MYNTLYVPLKFFGWQCMLMTTHRYRNDAREKIRDVPWEKRRAVEKEEERQRGKDRQDFAVYYEPRFDFGSLIHSELSDVLSFMREEMRLSQ
ncbi:hypothetical protein CY652_03000 [Burkholderia sp. WAC0059]|uniref:hypothetical protein n=1 Tax=Burkholderia sp. WAC0059 TaxID=2066022 RepID=UPI000C7F6CA9|nr:hypothetical protein [Burkholderia sp. WAC0059]PLZ03955.1 hypothetical protein CY652_03000 [Burkholderia sp. WAC0059]